MSSWSKKVSEDVLVACGRFCAICRKFKGVNIELHHIVPRADGGDNSFDNCIPLCFDCHADVESYNTSHPKGKKYTLGELKRTRDLLYWAIEEFPLDREAIESSPNVFSDKQFVWNPSEPLINANTKHIDKHPMDWKHDIENGRILGNANKSETMATGEVALTQHMIKYILTERGRYAIYPIDYGCESVAILFTTDDVNEFQRQAANLAESIMGYFAEWIQKLYAISRDEDVLVITFKVNGLPDTLVCRVPKLIEENTSRRPPVTKFYTIVEGDTLSKITHRHGKESSNWRDLYDVPENRPVIGNKPGYLEPGAKLIIPDNWLKDWFGNDE